MEVTNGGLNSIGVLLHPHCRQDTERKWLLWYQGLYFQYDHEPSTLTQSSYLQHHTGSVFMRKLCSQSNNHGNFSMLIMFNMCHFAVMSCKRLTNLMFYRVDFKTEKILEIYFFQFTDHVKIFDFDISLSPFIMCSNIKPNHCFIKTSTSHINLPWTDISL